MKWSCQNRRRCYWIVLFIIIFCLHQHITAAGSHIKMEKYSEKSERVFTEIETLDNGQKRASVSSYAIRISTSNGKSSSHCGRWLCLSVLTLILLGLLAGALAYYFLQPTPNTLKWWHRSTIYQIYPRSFQDSNDDGTGDLRGIIQRLPYLKRLGIDTVWLSPIFKSPMEDFGYDISNHTEIADIFGNMADFDDLIKVANEGPQKIRIILDFVPNHTSRNSTWFELSETGEDPKYRNYYVWHNGHPEKKKMHTNGSLINAEPNNWKGVFHGSAWTWSDKRQQYYLHNFLESMPDLNFRDSNVTEEMKNVLRFWLGRGVSGFRVDALPHLFEIPIDQMVDADDIIVNPYETNLKPSDFEYWLHPFTKNLQETVDYTREHWIRLMHEYSEEAYQKNTTEPKFERFLIFEVMDKNISQTMRYFPENPFVTPAMPFYFGLIEMNTETTGFDIDRLVTRQLNNLPRGAWPSWVIGNHDQRRATNRLGNVKLIDGLNMLNLLLPGIATTYYGEEIGMRDTVLPDSSFIQDPAALPYANISGEWEKKTRDYSRSPMQWNSSAKYAGFSEHEPWLPLAPGWDTEGLNVEDQTNANTSSHHTHYTLYRDLLRIRRTPAFTQGQFQTAEVSHDMYSFIRQSGDQQYLIAIDLRRNGTETKSYNFSRYGLSGTARIVCTNVENTNGMLSEGKKDVELHKVPLEPSTAVVLRVSHVH